MPASKEFVLPIRYIYDLVTEGVQAWNKLGRSESGLILRGAAGEPTHSRILEFARQLGPLRSPLVDVSGRDGIFVHDITPAAEGVKDIRGLLVLSTSLYEIPLHTDGFNADPPPDIVVQQVAVPGSGGDTTIAKARDLAQSLTLRTAELLSDPVFPTSRGTTAILFQNNDAPKMRFNEYEITAHLRHRRNSKKMTPAHVGALSELVEVIDYFESMMPGTRIHLERGDVMVLANGEVLNGRQALEGTDVHRLIHRVWCA